MKYIVKRILQAIPLLLIITFICFMLINLAPYDAIDSITTPDMTKQEIEAKREAYGLNDPVIVQYGRWLGNICRGEFGYSLRSRTSISYDLKSRIPSTIKLVLPSYLTAFLLAIVLGLVAGSHKNQWQDKLIDGICSIGIATPTFWFAMIIMFLFGYKLELFPLMGMHTIGKEDSILDFLQHFIMPYVVLTVGFIPDLTRYVRGSTIGQLKEDYVIVQKSFGASKAEILFKACQQECPSSADYQTWYGASDACNRSCYYRDDLLMAGYRTLLCKCSTGNGLSDRYGNSCVVFNIGYPGQPTVRYPVLFDGPEN